MGEESGSSTKAKAFEMALQPEDLSLILGTHTMERQNQLLKVVI